MNLVGNAVKFTEQGAVTIASRRGGVATTARPRVDLRFAVADTGIGIPARASSS